jgi:hypothetical protein
MLRGMILKSELVGEVGENLAKNAFVQLLGWTPRKEPLDDGVDFSVEIPGDEVRPTERFWVQVKTASEQKVKRDGSWAVSIKGSTARRYRKMRNAVFLVGVDVKSCAMRWLDLSSALRRCPEQRTFSLSPDSLLDAEGAPKLRTAVLAAIAAQDDRYHSPRQALEYRAQQVRDQYPGFQIKANLLDGIPHYILTPEAGTVHQLSLQLGRKQDARRLTDVMNFGSSADIQVRKFEIKGFPPLHDGDADALLTITSPTRRLRIGIEVQSAVRDAPTAYFELDSELSSGQQGIELKSRDEACPFEYRLQLDRNSLEGQVDFSILYERWNGRPLTQLPLLKQLSLLAQSFLRGGRLLFHKIEFGERREFLSTTLSPSRNAGLKQNAEYLQLLSETADVCREMKFAPQFNPAEAFTVAQADTIRLAHELTLKETVPWQAGGFHVKTESTIDYDLKDLQKGSLQLQTTLVLSMGALPIGEMPVKATFKEFTILRQDEGSYKIHVNSAVPLSRDLQRGAASS